MLYTTNYNLKKPESTNTVNIVDINDNMDALDTQLKAVSDAAAASMQPGINNKSIQEVKAIFIDTDTRRVDVTRNSGQITGMTIVDPTDSSTVATLSISRSSGQVTSISKVVGGKTITYSVNMASGQITSITKGVA